MKRLTTLFFVTALILAMVTRGSAQITAYSFSSSSGTFTPLTGATVPSLSGGSVDDGWYNSIPIGFTFTYDAVGYTVISASTNGVMTLGNTLTGSILTNNLTSGTPRPLIAPLWDDIEIAPTGSFSYKTEGTAGSMVFTAQWLNMYWNYAATTPVISFQVKLYEADGKVEFVYQQEAGAVNSGTASIGITAVGTLSGNFLSLNGTGPSPGVSSTTETTSLSSKPATGQIYAFSPPAPMSYTSSTTTQNTSVVAQGATNQWIIGMQVVTSGNLSPLSVSNFDLNTTGTTNLADISNAKIYYTGTSNLFAATNQFGSTVATPSGSYSVTGSRTLAGGTNYFWLTYDISPTATTGNLIDAECTAITVDGTPRTPTVTAPAGARAVAAPLSGPYSVGSGGDYTNLTAAFSDINLLGLSGNVTLNIISNITDSAATVNQWTEVGAGNYTLTIQPSGSARTISGSATSNAIIVLNGADRVSIDGRIAGSGNNLTIQNTSTGTTSAVIWVRSLGTGLGATNNTIRNCNIIGGSITGTAAMGIYAAGATLSSAGTGDDNDNLTIRENVFTKAYYAIYARASSATGELNGLLITQNTIGSSTAADYVTFRGVDVQYANAAEVSLNEIFNLRLTTLVNNAGIDLGAGVANTVVSRNKIYGLRSESTGGYGAYGVNISSSTATTNIQIVNNMIYDIVTIKYSSTSTIYNPFGIRITGGTNHKVYYNSVNMFGEPTVGTATTSMSAAFLVTSSAVTGLDVRNNVFANSMTGPATTKSYAVYVPSGTTFGTINNNDYAASGTFGILGYNGADVTSLTAWRTFSGQDGNSFVEVPAFTSPTDLHIPNGTTTQLESGGVPIAGITTDFDGDTRNATRPDVGADEFTGIVLDLTAPAISYTSLGNTHLTGNRTLAATITDNYSGVQRSTAGSPRLYFKKGVAGAYQQVTATESPATLFTFTIDHSLVGSVSVGDTVYYYAAAQDSANNAGSNPAGTSPTINPPNATVASPNLYRIVGTFAGGTYTIGSPTETNFPTVKAAFDSLNNNVVTGAVTLLINPGYAGESTFPIVLNAVNYAVGGPYTITLKPNTGATPTISGSSATAIFQLNGADYVTIDGSNTVGGTTRNFTIVNTNAAATTAAIQLRSLGTGSGATNNVIKNCNIATGSITLATYAISVGSTVGSTGNDNDTVTIENNRITNAYYGIYAKSAGTTTGLLDGLVIRGNIIGSVGATDSIGFRGIDVQGATAPLITLNEVFNVRASTALNVSGIELGQYVANAEVSRNRIYGLRSTSSSGYGAYGINIGSSTGTTNIAIVNNVIYDIVTSNYSVTSTTWNPFGIRITGGTNHKVYFNSINMFGAPITGTAASMSACFLVTVNTVTGLDVRNNIFANSMTGVAGTKSYSVYVPTGTAFGTINGNDYWASGTYGILGYFGGDTTTLAGWRTATGQDLNSLAADPFFSSNTTLQPYLGSSVLGAGVTGTGVTVDFLGVARGTPPSMGAYEEGVPSAMLYASSTVTQNSALVLRGTTNQQIIGMQVVTTGILSPISVTQFDLNTTGTTNTADISNANIFYTGTSSTFATTNQFGVTVATPSGSYSVTGTQTLANGTNYFWLTYDISPTATTGNFADAECTSITVDGTPRTPTVTAPSGNRLIRAPLSGPYTVGTGGNYATLTAAFADIALLGLGGNVTLNVISNITESATATLNQWTESGGSGYTLTIQPSGVARTISGTLTTSVISLNGSDRVTIDGRIGGSGNNLTIVNNSTAANTAAIWVKSLGTGQGAKYNTIRNCNISTGSNSATTFGVFVGGSSISSTGTGADNDTLTIQNNEITKAYYGIYASGVASTGLMDRLVVIGNTIGSSTTANQIGFTGIHVAQGTGGEISQNSLFNIIGTVTNPRGLNIATGFVNASVGSNKINSIKYTGTAGYGGKAIDINTGSATSGLTIVNNVIYDISGDGYSTFSSDCIVGIRILGSTGGLNIYYNSINLSGSISRSSATVDKSAAIYVVSTATALDIRDNAFVNSIENTTGVATAYAIYSDAANTAFTTINNNDYFVAGPEAMLGYLGSNIANIAAWQTATGQDANSIAADPLFNDPTNLRPQAASPLLLAGASIPGILLDYLGVTRHATTPTIGAYEQAGEFQAPVITYTALGNTSSTANRTLVATITDNNGVAGAPNGPRLYFKKSTDPSYTVDSSPTVAGNDYTFTINLTVTGGDVVQYYVAAQDINANVTTNPSGGSGSTPPGTTPPPSPNSYIIVGAPMSGDYTVGLTMFNKVSGKNLVPQRMVRKVMREVPLQGEAFAQPASKASSGGKGEVIGQTFAAAEAVSVPTRLVEVQEEYYALTENGKPYTGSLSVEPIATDGPEGGTEAVYATITAALADLNMRGVSGHTRFLLVDNTYLSEAYPLTIQVTSASVPSASATVTVKPSTGMTPVITGSVSGSIINITNTNYVTIDGSNTPGGTTRNLTLTNSSTSSPRVMVIGSIGTAPITNIEVKNCVVINGAMTSTAIIVGSATTPGDSGYFSAITIRNNDIQKAYHPCFIKGGPSLTTASNVSVLDNTLSTPGANAIRLTGTYVQHVNGVTISGNHIGNFSASDAETDKGLYLYDCINATIERNKISAIGYTGSSGYGAQGIAVYAARTGANILIKNNMISNIFGDGDSYSLYLGDNPMGIYVFGTNTGVNVYNNSVNLYGNTLGYSATSISIGICLGSGTEADVRNNAVKNNLGRVSATGFGAVGVYAATSAAQFTNLDRNAYFVNPTGTGVKAVGMIGSTSYTTLGDWQSASGKDVGSVYENIPYTFDYDLHIPNGTSTQLESWAAPLASVTDDYDGDPRHPTAPDIGADEFTGTAADNTPPAIVYTPVTNTHLTTNRTIAATISDVRSGVQRSTAGKPRLWYKKGLAGTYYEGTAVEAPLNTHTFTFDYSQTGPVAPGDTIYYYVAAQDSVNNVATVPAGTSPTANPPNATVTAPNSYRIVTAISGLKTVGTGGDYATLKAAFDAINNAVVTGAVTLSIITSTTETAPAVLNQYDGGSFTITIMPSGTLEAPVTISGSGAVTLDLNGADNVLIDGRSGGVGTVKDLTIENTSTSGIALRFINGAQSNTVKYAILKGVNTSTSTGTILISTGSATQANSSNLIENCTITKGATSAAVGMYITSSSTPVNTANTIRLCTISDFSSTGVYIGGGASNTTLERSDIFQTSPSTLTTIYGVHIAGSAPNLAISKNKIYGLQSTSSSATITGIYYYGASGVSMDVAIVNNFISLDATTTHVGATISGVDYYGFAANSCYIYYNSVYIGGSSVTSGTTRAFYKRDAIATLQAKNNIWFNARSNSTGTGKHYAIFYSNTTATTLAMDYNDYFVSGTGGVLGYWGTADQATLAAWRTASGQDANSISADPIYLSTTNLHINVNGPSPVNNVGTPIAGITDDIDGDARHATTPDMGADEFSPNIVVVGAPISSGWSMNSNPVTRSGIGTETDSVKHLYPTAINQNSFAFVAGSGYVQSFTMANRKGYWLKFPLAGTQNIAGYGRPNDSIPVVLGWNLVGSISCTIDTVTITSVPPGLKATNWFGYNNGYTADRYIVPGKGYWIKSTGIGAFLFNCATSVVAKAEATEEPEAVLFSSITITDAEGNKQTLEFGADASNAIDVSQFEMPPTPPEGAFDARFSAEQGGFMLQTHGAVLSKSVEMPIDIQAVAYPLTISWKIAAAKEGQTAQPDYTYELTDGLGGKAFGTQTMSGEGTMTIRNRLVSRFVLVTKNGEQLPTEYALYQNYPNPFNPTTNIKFALPVPSKVTVEVYNILGQRVRTLLDEQRPAGYHVAEWNGKNDAGQNIGTGVYFVRMSADGGEGHNFSQVKKVMMLK